MKGGHLLQSAGEKMFFPSECTVPQARSCFAALSITSSNNTEIHSVNKIQD